MEVALLILTIVVAYSIVRYLNRHCCEECMMDIMSRRQ